VFEYIAERGIMVNPEDHQRNVSFRTDTFISMFAGIYDSVVEIAGDKRASEILHSTGYTCGANFAQRLNSQWDLSSQNDDNFEEKLKKWCEFDSDVGWGRFDIDVSINRETGDFSGELSINECFIVDKKNKRPVCSFVKGYCEGVMETLLCTKVRLDCIACPLTNRFKSVCKFNIVLCD
jgi:predicted hydrocarbon binding protein